MDLTVESALRTAIMDWVRERADANGTAPSQPITATP